MSKHKNRLGPWSDPRLRAFFDVDIIVWLSKKSRKTTYKINDAMGLLLPKLDEAIDDMENGRVQTIDDAWAEKNIRK